MMFFITFVTCLIVPVLSRYPGDPCSDQNIQGTCTPLSHCRALMDEIKAAGNPMPMHMRRRLDKLRCGFTNDEPVVCCSHADTNSNTNSPPVDIDVSSNLGATTDGTRGSQTATTNSNQVNPDSRDTNGPQDVTNHPNLRLLPKWKDCGNIDGDRILGGNRTQLYEMPWMVILSYDDDGVNKLGCGGTLINKRYVLTAAHCVTLGSRMTLNGVILGDYDIRSDPDCEVFAGNKTCAPGVVNATIADVISHPGYSRQTLLDDIALLRLAEPAPLNLDNIGPICLPITRSLQRQTLEKHNGVAVGWGITEEKIQSPVLMSVGLPIVTNEECQAAYGTIPRILSKQLCAGGVIGKDSCSGDSGGPLLFPGNQNLDTSTLRYVQRGVVSFGPKKCGVGRLPGVYTRVSHYMKWILDNIRN